MTNVFDAETCLAAKLVDRCSVSGLTERFDVSGSVRQQTRILARGTDALDGTARTRLVVQSHSQRPRALDGADCTARALFDRQSSQARAQSRVRSHVAAHHPRARQQSTQICRWTVHRTHRAAEPLAGTEQIELARGDCGRLCPGESEATERATEPHHTTAR